MVGSGRPLPVPCVHAVASEHPGQRMASLPPMYLPLMSMLALRAPKNNRALRARFACCACYEGQTTCTLCLLVGMVMHASTSMHVHTVRTCTYARSRIAAWPLPRSAGGWQAPEMGRAVQAGCCTPLPLMTLIVGRTLISMCIFLRTPELCFLHGFVCDHTQTRLA